MTEETKEQIQVILSLLKKCLVKNGASMYLDTENKSIGFFDVDTYLTTKKLDGITVSINDLVKDNGGVEKNVT